MVIPLIMILVFRSIYTNDSSVIADYKYPELVFYYLISGLIVTLLPLGVDSEVSEQIKQGVTSFDLIKPISHIKKIFFDNLAWRIFRAVITSGIFILIISLFSSQITKSTVSLSPSLLAVFCFSYLLTFLICYIVGLSAFWITDSYGFVNVRMVLIMLLGGQILPVTFLPDGIGKINNYLPFKYLISFPVSVAQNKLSGQELISGIVIQLIWLFILFLICRTVWRRGIIHYSAIGG